MNFKRMKRKFKGEVRASFRSGLMAGCAAGLLLASGIVVFVAGLEDNRAIIGWMWLGAAVSLIMFAWKYYEWKWDLYRYPSDAQEVLDQRAKKADSDDHKQRPQPG